MAASHCLGEGEEALLDGARVTIAQKVRKYCSMAASHYYSVKVRKYRSMAASHHYSVEGEVLLDGGESLSPVRCEEVLLDGGESPLGEGEEVPMAAVNLSVKVRKYCSMAASHYCSVKVRKYCSMAASHYCSMELPLP